MPNSGVVRCLLDFFKAELSPEGYRWGRRFHRETIPELSLEGYRWGRRFHRETIPELSPEGYR